MGVDATLTKENVEHIHEGGDDERHSKVLASGFSNAEEQTQRLCNSSIHIVRPRNSNMLKRSREDMMRLSDQGTVNPATSHNYLPTSEYSARPSRTRRRNLFREKQVEETIDDKQVKCKSRIVRFRTESYSALASHHNPANTCKEPSATSPSLAGARRALEKLKYPSANSCAMIAGTQEEEQSAIASDTIPLKLDLKIVRLRLAEQEAKHIATDNLAPTQEKLQSANYSRESLIEKLDQAHKEVKHLKSAREKEGLQISKLREKLTRANKKLAEYKDAIRTLQEKNEELQAHRCSQPQSPAPSRRSKLELSTASAAVKKSQLHRKKGSSILGEILQLKELDSRWISLHNDGRPNQAQLQNLLLEGAESEAEREEYASHFIFKKHNTYISGARKIIHAGKSTLDTLQQWERSGRTTVHVGVLDWAYKLTSHRISRFVKRFKSSEDEWEKINLQKELMQEHLSTFGRQRK